MNRRMYQVLLVVLLAMVVPLSAGTQITDTVKDAAGNTVNGTVTFTPIGPFVTDDGQWISSKPVSARIVSGALSISLQGGQFYTVTWQPSSIAGAQFAYVPASTVTLQLRDVIATQVSITTGAGATFVDGETPAGAIDGTNATFTVAHAPSPSSSLSLYWNGIRMKQGLDFTLSGVTLVMQQAPGDGDVLLVAYRH